MSDLDFASFAASVEHRADGIVANDERAGDPESAHFDQDRLAHEVLRWIARHSTDERARIVAEQAARPFETDGARWYA